MHAHIETGIAPYELERLGAVVFVATRDADDFEHTLNRSDRVTVWGLGCHPGVASALAGFNVERYTELIQRTPYLGEVGLDGAAKTDMKVQTKTFRSILVLAAQTPRLVSVHSKRATAPVLDIIAECGASGVILHWWLGTVDQTAEALQLGCHFSVNRSMDCRRLRNAGVPLTRLLPETDHPAGNRGGSGLRQPGWTSDVEVAVAEAYGVSPGEVRAQFWATLAALSCSLGLDDFFPRPVRAMLAVARGRGR
ncbi:TatD family hydrolase [Rhodococcus sp. 2G]|uniref:TatD family hydrolase n=1 Tax=Rhodococcus sp. 2G TaxID=1570939 RepID=UPI000903807D|nr:TatD family hydrolase [Rhodococcus sp. 2G]